MPTYAYRCEHGHEFEKFQSMQDEPLTECEVMYEGPVSTLGLGGEIVTVMVPKWKCYGKVEKLINFQGGVKVVGGTPKHYA